MYVCASAVLLCVRATFFSLSAYEATVPAGRQALIKTDLSIAIPPNTYARIAPRSGLAVKKMIDVGAGVVDYDYRGPVGVVLFNHGSEDFKVNKGDRVAQLILERICMADIEEVSHISSFRDFYRIKILSHTSCFAIFTESSALLLLLTAQTESFCISDVLVSLPRPVKRNGTKRT